MKRILRTLLLIFAACAVQAQHVTFNGNKVAAIIDVRNPEEYAGGHIAGAINLPYERVGQGIQTIKGVHKDSPVLLYCRSGRRSALARTKLQQQGYRRVMDGGAMTELIKTIKPCTRKTC